MSNDTNSVILHELQELTKRMIRMETRLFRLAEAIGHKDVMYERGKTEGNTQIKLESVNHHHG